MKTKTVVPATIFRNPKKAPTGIAGLDEITQGGIPRGRTTLVEGGPGSGKTILSLQSLVNGARLEGEAGIFVAFEESPERILSNATTFGWDIPELVRKKLFFLDAQPAADLLQSGGFDLGGMLAAIDGKAKEMNAKRIVFDAIDIVLKLMPDPADRRREIYGLHQWLLTNGYTAIITSKVKGEARKRVKLSFLQFMVDCAIMLNQEVLKGVSQRNLRVLKYRGSTFSENESPFLIGRTGLEIAGAREMGRLEARERPKIEERVSSGVARLDSMLGGGYYRGAGVLITGFPGTAKSTLGGAFAAAACKRGERTLFISFDSDADEVLRNLASVGIRLHQYVKKGLLHMVSARAVAGSAEIHLMQIKNLAREHRADCMVIDPVSSLAKAGNEDTAYSVAERLIDWTKGTGITLVCTSLLHEAWAQMEGTPLQISTIADTWIHLNYVVHAGERNRGLSIIKSRGTQHSNQVRELVLSSKGVTLADAYTAGGEVLMGTLRWEKELAVRAARDETQMAARQREAIIEKEEMELEVRLRALQRDLDLKRDERTSLRRAMTERSTEITNGRNHLRELRGSDKK
jgi:circadian clock protein KaiC